MRRRKTEERILGPYGIPKASPRRWQIIQVAADGERRSVFFPTSQEADQHVAELKGELASLKHTIWSAKDLFIEYLKSTNHATATVGGYEWALKVFFDTDLPLPALNVRWCERRYRELVDSNKFSVDSHRNALKMSRTFLKWCVKSRFIKENPLTIVEGEGRRKRGKPQLRIDEARKLYTAALPLAMAGDDKATAVLVCLLMGNRSGELMHAQVRDIDDGGRILWIAVSKTEAGRRPLEIPEVLQDPLRKRAGKLAEGEHGPELPSNWPLFPPRNRKWLWTAVVQLCDSAGVPRVPPHGLRGGVATTGRMGGMSAEAMAMMLGHANTRVQDDHYVDQDALEAEERRKNFKMLQGGVK